ncbi:MULTISPECIES: tRNA (cytidine(34)-2'-O)-methyltransferase [unclassified Xanthobacter]|uniref:tRNA (cytidine(34)-2'-O)-methyltransferase n=1 Tax=unclassified Xanthobacter TaxID=2623496 RepID=UPI001EDD49A2|nr:MULTISPECIES: tRNA (cytidine(34)-2'-O)-methyltransferase [unclassified Xanthobacter]
MILALYCPDIAQNAGTCLRTGACFGVPVHIIEPTGFPLGSAGFRRAGMDYIDAVEWHRHTTFSHFTEQLHARRQRLVLFTTQAEQMFTDFRFSPDDALLFGRESAGVPAHVHAAADARVTIPMRPGLRSLNLAVSAGIGLAEALRQTRGFPTG